MNRMKSPRLHSSNPSIRFVECLGSLPSGRDATGPGQDVRVLTYRKILFICHANTSRSIIAEALLKRMLEERALDDHLTVQSGGMASYARDGALVSMDARLVLRDEGIHIPSDAVSTDLKRNRHLIAAADLILAMTAQQVQMLREASRRRRTRKCTP